MFLWASRAAERPVEVVDAASVHGGGAGEADEGGAAGADEGASCSEDDDDDDLLRYVEGADGQEGHWELDSSELGVGAMAGMAARGGDAGYDHGGRLRSRRPPPLPPPLQDMLPQRLSHKIETLSANPPSNPLQACLDVASAMPDLASLALPPRFAGDVCTLMGGADGTQRSSTGIAVGVLLAPVLAVSQIARLWGIELTPETFGFNEDVYLSPASAAARLDSIDLRQICVAKDVDIPTCAICQCDFEDGVFALVMIKCAHMFHAQCLNPWLDRRNTCPCCRETVSAVEKVQDEEEKDTKEEAVHD